MSMSSNTREKYVDKVQTFIFVRLVTISLPDILYYIKKLKMNSGRIYYSSSDWLTSTAIGHLNSWHDGKNASLFSKIVMKNNDALLE